MIVVPVLVMFLTYSIKCYVMDSEYLDAELSDEEISNFIEAGKATAKIREESKKLIMVDGSVRDTIETIENMIVDEGVGFAFPVNISINNIAAHFTLGNDDGELLFGENDVVKVDLGCEVNSGLGDSAYTMDLGEKNGKLLEASKTALEKALSMAKPGVNVKDIGKLIEETITSYGFKPIRNLSGHKIVPGILHAGVNIPNVADSEEDYALKEGDIFACEPFATNGAGFVVDMDDVRIFGLMDISNVNMRQSRKILDYIIDKYQFLPFAERWIYNKFKSRLLVKAALKELLQRHIIMGYPVLKEAGDGLVSQFEHTFLVKDKGVKVLTK